MTAAETETKLGSTAGAVPNLPDQPSPPATWAAEALVTAWQDVFRTIEAHLEDRIRMRDPASPETYLSIIRADVADVQRSSQQIINARWADSARYQAEIKRLEAAPTIEVSRIEVLALKKLALINNALACSLQDESARREQLALLQVLMDVAARAATANAKDR